MSKMPMTYDVYGRKLTVEFDDDTWRIWHHGSDGKRRPAVDLPIPPGMAPEEIEFYLADLCHEWATAENPSVRRLA